MSQSPVESASRPVLIDRSASHRGVASANSGIRKNRRAVIWIVVLVLGVAALATGGWVYCDRTAGKTTLTGSTPEDVKFPVFRDGRVHLSEATCNAIGLTLTHVKPQDEPIRLELLGTTAYDEQALSRVRTMLKGRVDKVHVVGGQAVKKGEPLIDLYSTDLAEAKCSFEIAQIRWTYTKNLLENRSTLQTTGAIPIQLIRETQSNELRDRQEVDVARDKLLVFGLTEPEIDNIHKEVGQEKARFTLRSPADGVIVERNVVAGNLYDENDTLFVIATLDHLWVWGNVFENDLHLLQMGQRWDIEFPFLGRRVPCHVEYVSNRVDPGTRAVRIRTSVPNPDGLLKSDMLVRGMLYVPMQPGRTVVPRTSVVVSEGRFFVFVPSSVDPHAFDRTEIRVAYEKDDYVLVESGIVPDQQVVSTGALYLAQIFDDIDTTHPAPVRTAKRESTFGRTLQQAAPRSGGG